MYDDDASPWGDGGCWARWRAASVGGKEVKGVIHYAPDAGPLLVIRKHRLLANEAAFNPSIVVRGDDLLVVVRSGRGLVLGRWVEGRLLEDAVVQIHEPLASGLLVCGAQDCRLFMFDGALHGVMAVGLRAPGQGTPIRQGVVRFASPPGPLSISDAWLQPGDSLEKNWMPAVDQLDGQDRLRLVYSAGPLVVLDYDKVAHRVVQDVNAASKATSGSTIRGGSGLIAYEGGWLAVVHELHSVVGRGKVYSHRFALFNADLSGVRMSPAFYLNHLGIEFVAGLALHQGRYFLSYGDEDREAWLAEVAPETVTALLAGKAAPPVPPVFSPPSDKSSGPGNPCLGGYGWG